MGEAHLSPQNDDNKALQAEVEEVQYIEGEDEEQTSEAQLSPQDDDKNDAEVSRAAN